jgi:hypothetical protein
VRPPDHAAALELGQVAARGHPRDAVALPDLGDRDRAGRLQALGDLNPARLGEHSAP